MNFFRPASYLFLLSDPPSPHSPSLLLYQGMTKKGASHLLKSETSRGVNLPPPVLASKNGKKHATPAPAVHHVSDALPPNRSTVSPTRSSVSSPTSPSIVASMRARKGDKHNNPGPPPGYQDTHVVHREGNGPDSANTSGGKEVAVVHPPLSAFAGARLAKKKNVPIPVEVAKFPPDLPDKGETYEPQDGPNRPNQVHHVPAFWQTTKGDGKEPAKGLSGAQIGVAAPMAAGASASASAAPLAQSSVQAAAGHQGAASGVASSVSHAAKGTGPSTTAAPLQKTLH